MLKSQASENTIRVSKQCGTGMFARNPLNWFRGLGVERVKLNQIQEQYVL